MVRQVAQSLVQLTPGPGPVGPVRLPLSPWTASITSPSHSQSLLSRRPLNQTGAPLGEGFSSQQALLDPHVHTGQVLTWFSTASAYPNKADCHGAFCDITSHSLLIACSVSSTSKAGLLMTTRVRMFAPQTPVGGTVDFPSIIVRSGHILAADGTPFKREPLCSLYSTDLWGSPPAVIRAGATWSFNRPSGYVYNLYHGVVSVKAVNAQTGDVSLHVDGGDGHTIDFVVAAGGIVISKVERWALRDTTGVETTSLQHRSLARLWHLPQPVEPDILNPNGRLLDVSRSRLVPSLYMVRVWHFGPYFLTVPTPPTFSDLMLFFVTWPPRVSQS